MMKIKSLGFTIKNILFQISILYSLRTSWSFVLVSNVIFGQAYKNWHRKDFCIVLNPLGGLHLDILPFYFMVLV